MKRRKMMLKGLSLCLLLIYLFFPFGQTVSAQPPTDAGFEEDFEGQQLPDGWESTPDTTVSDGALRLYGGNFAMRLGRWGAQTSQVRLRFNTSMGEFLIHYFASDQGSYNLVFLPDTIFLERGTG